MARTRLCCGVISAAAALMAAGSAFACDLDGVIGAHRYNPFQSAVATTSAPASPSRQTTRVRASTPQARGEDRRRSSGRRSDDGQGYATYSAAASDTSEGGGVPGDADWIHSARDR